MKGSAPILAGLVAAFLLAFTGLRWSSPFLRIEREADVAQQVALRVGLAAVDVMALRELLGADLPLPDLEQRGREFVRLRGLYGEGLAAVAVAGHAAVASAAFAAAGGDGALAWSRFQGQPEAIWGVRFLAMRARFAGRAASAVGR